MSKSNRQKKIEKRKAKAKVIRKKANISKSLSREAKLLTDSLELPVYECIVNDNWKAGGILNLMISKKLINEEIVIAVFLVDVFCLGVKDCFINIVPFDRYLTTKAEQPHQDMKPEDAKKLLFEVVTWSRKIGFQPHKDYKKSVKILDGINIDDSTAEFEFGKDGEPLFISGPNDSPGKCNKILRILENYDGKFIINPKQKSIDKI